MNIHKITSETGSMIEQYMYQQGEYIHPRGLSDKWLSDISTDCPTDAERQLVVINICQSLSTHDGRDELINYCNKQIINIRVRHKMLDRIYPNYKENKVISHLNRTIKRINKLDTKLYTPVIQCINDENEQNGKY